MFAAPVKAIVSSDEAEPNRFIDTIICGDSWEIAATLPACFFQCIVTSPPYFGHRIYTREENAGQEFGREANPKEYSAKLVALFAGLRGSLKDSGTVWLNLGDTYRDGQLLGIPWRTAIALQDNGWILRSEVIWNKPNAMPSSVRNRPTTSHEHIFLFSKSADYYYNADAIREPHVTFSEHSRMKGGRNHFGKRDSTPEEGKNKGKSNLHDGRWDQAFHPLGRNKRTVWDIPLGKFREAHFAVFPPALAETCILAGSESGDVVLDPFMGAGTTAVVAKQNQRHYSGIELVPEYVEIARARVCETQQKLF